MDCKISPLVVFSILDHYMRRSEGQQRVIGTLLGSNNDGVLEITNAFPVPHTETESVGILIFDLNYFNYFHYYLN
jgi:translation initiation factor 3 subunit F